MTISLGKRTKEEGTKREGNYSGGKYGGKFLLQSSTMISEVKMECYYLNHAAPSCIPQMWAHEGSCCYFDLEAPWTKPYDLHLFAVCI